MWFNISGLYLHPLWELSSAGSEHLPYKQGVAGSNPAVPTTINSIISMEFFFDTGVTGSEPGLSKKYKKLTAKVTENLRREPQSIELQDFNFLNSAYTLRTLRLKKPF